MIKKIIWCGFYTLPLFFFHTFQIFSQEPLHIKFDNLSLKDGLSQSSVNCIWQDSQGLMWFGTEDGLNKYDGYSFSVYKPESTDTTSITDNRISCIYEDKSGNLWIGTNSGGLNRFDRNLQQFIHYTPAPGSDNNASLHINSVMEHSNGTIFIGTDYGLYRADTAANTYSRPFFREDAALFYEHAAIKHMVEDKEHNLWLATNKGLVMLSTENNGFMVFSNSINDSTGISSNTLTCLFIDSDDILWAGTENGLNRMEKDSTFTRFITGSQRSKTINNNHITSLIEDDNKRLWIGTMGGGINLYSKNNNSFSQLMYQSNNPYSLSYDEVLSLYKDMSGIIWAGTNGLDKYNRGKEKFRLYDYVPYSKENLVYRNIHSIHEDHNGILWIASKSDGIHLLDRDNKQSQRITVASGGNVQLASNKVRVIEEFKPGILWIAYDDRGFSKCILDDARKPVSIKHFVHDENDHSSLSSNRVYSIYALSDSALLIGTDNGLNRFNTKTGNITRFLPGDNDTTGMNNPTAYCLYGVTGGDIWIATDMGINVYHPEKNIFTHYLHDESDTNSLSNNEILTFYESNNNKIWIGTYGGGLNKFDPSTSLFTRYNHIKELSTAVIYGIIEDNTNKLWLSTNNGLIRFDPANEKINQFSIEDGLQSNEYNGGSYYKSSSGEIFFGGQYGFNSFYPDDVRLDPVPPKLLLTDFRINNKSVQPGENSPVQKHISGVEKIRLSHKQNNFTLHFAALHYANPKLNKYKYKLEGFDKNWIESGTQRFASYTNLPYKNYVFRVIASNNDGTWNTEGINLAIKIIPPLWKRWWFISLAVIILVAILISLMRQRRKNAVAEKKLLREKLEKGRDEIEKQKAEIRAQSMEIKMREKEQAGIRWYNESINKLSDLLSRNKGDIKKLSAAILSGIIEYTEANAAILYLVNDENAGNTYLEAIAHFGGNKEKTDKKIEIGEGQVGTCFKEKKIIELNEVSDDYYKISSGLGNDMPKHIAFVPLKHDELVLGVLEIASFSRMKGYKIMLLEKLAENITSTLATERANARLKKMIEKSETQAREMALQEEEMRQNMEEMMSTQEEAARREDELIQMAEESASREEELNARITELENKISELQEQTTKSIKN